MHKKSILNKNFFDIEVYHFYAIKHDRFHGTPKQLNKGDVVQVEDIWEKDNRQFVYVYHMKKGFRVPVLAEDLTDLFSIPIELSTKIDCPVCGPESATYYAFENMVTCSYCGVSYPVSDVDYV